VRARARARERERERERERWEKERKYTNYLTLSKSIMIISLEYAVNYYYVI